MAHLAVEVKLATKDSLPLLKRHLPYGPPTKHAERLDRQQRGQVVYLVAWHQGQPVGHGLLKWGGAEEYHIASAFQGTCPDVEDLLVLESFRSRGVGTQILEAAENLVRERGFRQIGLSVDVDDNPRAQALYERLGFRDAGLGSHHERGEYLDQDGQLQTWQETCIYLVKLLG